MLDLVHRALPRRFVGAIANDLRPVAKTAAGKMIVGDFNDDLRIDRLPFAASLRAPTARPARRVSGETRLFL